MSDYIPEIRAEACDKFDRWRDRLDQTTKPHKRDMFECAAADLFLEAEHERDLGAVQAIRDAIYFLGRDHTGLSDDDIQYIMVGAKAKAKRLIDDAPENSSNAKSPATFNEHNYELEASDKAERQNDNLSYFGDLGEAKPKLWSIKNVMARGECSSWFGPPGVGKSALLEDLHIHGAYSQQWRGYRIKQNFASIYFALERADLVKRRMIAHRARDNLPADLPIAIWSGVIDLMSQSCVGIILDTIKRAEDHFSREIDLATFDTYAKGIAAGGGDESQAKDQNIALSNLRRVLERKSMHIATIGHAGKDESRGERGSNAKQADVDLEVQISGKMIIKSAVVTKGNDQPQGLLTNFELEPFDFGLDEDGDPFRTYIMAQQIISRTAAKNRPLTDKQQIAMDALAEAILSHGVDLPSSYGLAVGLKAVTADQWRDEFFRHSIVDPKAKNPHARFNDIVAGLQVRRVIGLRDKWAWIAKI